MSGELSDYWPVLLVILIILIFMWKGTEKFVVRTVDQTAARHPDPILFKYTGRMRDNAGRDGYDYYYENTMMHNQHTRPSFEGEPAFLNQMPDVRLRATAESAFSVDEVMGMSGTEPSSEPFAGSMSY